MVDDGEVWKWVPGYDGFYEVSSLGRVRTYRNRKWGLNETPRVLSESRVGGYKTYSLSRVGVQTTFRAHVLVLIAFAGERPSGYDGCHLNGNRQDNRAVNLCWGSRQLNADHAKIHGTRAKGAKNGQSKLTEAQVFDIHRMASSGYRNKDMVAKFGVGFATIHSILNGVTWRDQFAKAAALRGAP